jgi:hypothetical protein
MAQPHLSIGASPLKGVAPSVSLCPFLITDCEDDDSGSNAAAVTSSSSTGGTPTKKRFGYSRQEKSLGTLTRRFMSLLRQSKTGVMDLKHVSFLSFNNNIRSPHTYTSRFYIKQGISQKGCSEYKTRSRKINIVSLIDVIIIGRGFTRYETKTTNIRYYKCT